MKKRLMATIALGAIAALGLAGCSSDDSGSNGASDSNGQSSASKDLTIGVFSGWPEGIATSYLWQAVLDDKGYDVTLGTPAEAGPVFAGASKGDYDLLFDVWLPNTHKSYWAKYGDDLEDLGTWYDNAPLTVAVNKDAPIDSLDELAAHADEFGNKIVGIEPGAGLTAVMKDSVIPAYGLDKMDFVTSSTAAMLAALKGATQKGENIVVTLWKPQWAYAAFDLKDLKDPKNALGDPDGIHVVGDKGFAEDHPEVAGWLGKFTFPDDLLADLEKQMFQPDADGNTPDASQYPDIVKQWVTDHQDYVDSLTAA